MAKVEDLQQNAIDLELMHMPPPDRPFDVQAFYKVLRVVFLILIFSETFCSCHDEFLKLYNFR